MSRNLESTTIAALSNEKLISFHLLTFYFGTPFRLTDHQHQLTYDFGSGTETFLSSGRLASSGSIKETLELSNPSISVILTGANEADIALALTEDFNDRRVVIRRGFFDGTGETTDSNIIAAPFIIFDGRVNSYTITDDPTSGESSVTWSLVSHWADWEKVNGRKCNNQNAQLEFPSEDGFSHTYDQVGQRNWGKIKS